MLTFLYLIIGAKIVEQRKGRIAAIRWVRSSRFWQGKNDLASFKTAKALVLNGTRSYK